MGEELKSRRTVLETAREIIPECDGQRPNAFQQVVRFSTKWATKMCRCHNSDCSSPYLFGEPKQPKLLLSRFALPAQTGLQAAVVAGEWRNVEEVRGKAEKALTGGGTKRE